MKFELKPYNRDIPDNDLIEDLKKVANKFDKQTLTAKEYTESGMNKFYAGTISRRFNGWNKALEKAGLIVRINRDIPDQELIEDLKRVARLVLPQKVTQKNYNENGKYSSETIHVRFGWNNALKKAGLEISVQQNISDEELFNNLEELWVKLGRQPGRRDMILPYSRYSERPYINRFTTWRKALETFIEYVNQEESSQVIEGKNIPKEDNVNSDQKRTRMTKRDINWRLRFIVMRRDNFKCKNCGRSPATDQSIILHVDHVKAWANGGETVLENLQTLCSVCNIGKSNLE